MDVYNKIKRDIGLLIIGALIIAFLLNATKTGWDSTDGETRSGMGLYIDNRTGCHYLSAGASGGITPRLDRDGTHICSGP